MRKDGSENKISDGHATFTTTSTKDTSNDKELENNYSSCLKPSLDKREKFGGLGV